jgi:hypothetical protein
MMVPIVGGLIIYAASGPPTPVADAAAGTTAAPTQADGFVYVMGAVERPGAYRLPNVPDRLSLTQLLTTAGGPELMEHGGARVLVASQEVDPGQQVRLSTTIAALQARATPFWLELDDVVNVVAEPVVDAGDDGWRRVTLHDVDNGRDDTLPRFVDFETGAVRPLPSTVSDGGREAVERYIEALGLDAAVEVGIQGKSGLIGLQAYGPPSKERYSVVMATTFPVTTTVLTVAGNAYDVELLSDDREADSLTFRYRPAAADPRERSPLIPEAVGVWVGREVGGDGVRRVTVIQGTHILYQDAAGRELYSGQIVAVDPTKAPRRFVVRIDASAVMPRAVGQRVLAIWAVEGEGDQRVLRYASFGPGATGYPDDFVPGNGSRAFEFRVEDE